MEPQENLSKLHEACSEEPCSEQKLGLDGVDVNEKLKKIYEKMDDIEKNYSSKIEAIREENRALRDEIVSHQKSFSFEDNHSPDKRIFKSTKINTNELFQSQNDSKSSTFNYKVKKFLLIGSRKRNVIYNTETIHMHAVYNIENHKNLTGLCFTTLRSLFTISFQVFIMWYLLLETSNTPCSAHTDCSEGEYCNPDFYKKTRCLDCHYMFDLNINDKLTKECAPYAEVIANYRWQYDNIDHQVYRFNALTGNIDTNVFPFYNDTIGTCTSYLHCVENDIMETGCDFVSFNRARLNVVGIITLLFLSVGLAASLASDSVEASVEEKLMNHLVAKNLCQMSHAATISSHVIRLCLRIRKYILPFLATAATSSVIILDSLTVEKIILNILSIVYLTEIDNMLAKLFLRTSQLEKMSDLVKDSIEEDRTLGVPVVAPKTASLFAITYLVFSISFIENIMVFYNNPDKGWVQSYGCEFIERWFVIVGSILVPFFFILGSYILASIRFLVNDSITNRKGLMKRLIEFLTNLLAYAWTLLFFFIALLTHDKYFDPKPYGNWTTTKKWFLWIDFIGIILLWFLVGFLRKSAEI